MDNDVKQHSDRSVDSFTLIYNKWRKPVFHYLLSLLKREDLADDLTQDVFMRIYTKGDICTTEMICSSQIFTIAKHIAYDHFRKEKCELEKLHNFLAIAKQSGVHLPTQLGLDEDFLKTETEAVISNAINSLPALEKTVIEALLCNKKKKDIIKETGISLYKITKIVERARKKIYRSLKVYS